MPIHKFLSHVFFLAVICGTATLGIPELPAQNRRASLTAEESLSKIELAAGYSARLLASEPQVVDPVDVAFDDAGRLWVVEMRDYPFRVAEEARGRIRVLQDGDNDGVFDSAVVFADNLEMPTGLALWKDGIVVTLAGRLVFIRDRDGDLVADERQDWLVGFSEDNEQLRANHPRLGLDGTWTIASGLRGGKIRLGSHFEEAEATSAAVNIGSRDVQFDPENGKIELITGPAQFGLCFDVLGHRFFCSNRNPAVQVIFEQNDLVGNPLAGVVPSVLDVVPAGEQSEVFPLVNAWTTSNLHSGQFTAACGVFVRSESVAASNRNLLGLRNEIFTCEPTGSLVKRSVANCSSYHPTIVLDSQDEQREWLASRDAWFRPVNLALAPDGELVVVDMHRAVIEHPQWVPEELKNRTDERWGEDAGRVYWIGQNKFSALQSVLNDLRSRPLGTRSDQELGTLVASSNPWMRETASRLLVERKSQVGPQLAEQATDEQAPLLGRIAALRLGLHLADKEPLDVASIVTAKSPPALQVAALRELRSTDSFRDTHHHQLIEELLSAADDSVRFEALLSAGQLSKDGLSSKDGRGENVSKAVQTAVTRTDEAYVLAAAGSAMRAEPVKLLAAWLNSLRQSRKESPGPHDATIAQALAKAALAAGEKSHDELFDTLASVDLSTGSPAARVAALSALCIAASQNLQRMDDAIWMNTIKTIETTHVPELRQQAIELLSHSTREFDREFLAQRSQLESDPELKAALLTAWSKHGGQEFDDYLFQVLPSSSPSMMARLLDLIGQRPERLSRLATEIDTGRLSARQVGAGGLKKLVTRAGGDTKTFLQQQLNSLVNSNRNKVLQEYKACLELAGEPIRGKQVFKTHCASCHRIAEMGVQVGPDISDSRTQQPLQLLTSILNPNLAIDNNYFRVVILTQDDEIVEGIVAEETTDAIILRGQEDKRTLIKRAEIKELKATGVSLMPEGVEAQIDQQSMADLISFIKGWRYLDGAIPGK